MKHCVDKVYYPIQPLYSQVWKSHNAKTVQEIAQPQLRKIAEREDLSLEDKKKAGQKAVEQTELAAREDAEREVEEQNMKVEKIYETLLEMRTRRFVNESDFQRHTDDRNAVGEINFKQFVNQYIHYRYEPTDEEFEEERYFCENFDESLLKHMEGARNYKRKVNSIKLKCI